MEIFPYSLIRLGGDSIDNWSVNDTQEIINEIEKIGALRKSSHEKKESLCEDLLSFIKEQADPAKQNQIQNLRRDIYNQRKIKNNKLNKAKEVLSTELKSKLDEYLGLLQDIKSREEGAEDIYKKEVYKCREDFKKVVNSEDLKKGLILSSRSLLTRLESYYNKSIEDYRKKEFQTEQSLLQYISRMYAKTSPFSTFTNLSAGVLDSDNKGINLAHKKNGNGHIKSHIRLNNYLFKYIFDLLRNYRDAYLWFSLRNNPTIQNREDHFLFLTNNNNIESFQRVPYNPVVDHIRGIVAENEKGIRFKDLVKNLGDDIDASEEELEAYVKQLIDYGFLEYNLGVSGIDPDWDLSLKKELNILSDNNVEHIQSMIDTLDKVRSLGNNYAKAGVEERQQILKEAFDIFRESCMVIHEAAGLPEDERKTEEQRMEEWKAKKAEEKEKSKKEGEAEEEKPKEEEEKKDEKEEEVTFKHETSTFFSFKPEQIFYEDTTREVSVSMNQAQIEQITDELYDLLNHIRLFQGQLDEKDKMKAYFIKKYGTGQPVDLLTFYEDYFREFKKPEKERMEKQKQEAEEAYKKKKEEEAKKQSEGEGKAEEVNSDKKEGNEKDKAEEEKKKKENEQNILPSIKARNETHKKWTEAFKATLDIDMTKALDEVVVDIKQVEKANSEVAYDQVQAVSNSYGSFVQYYEEDGELKAVINSTFPGYGKMMSRFLHIFDENITSEIKEWNNKLSDESSIFIEDCDASYFNANLHPTLMPHEIWMPGGHNALPADKQLPITDFEVTVDDESSEIRLVHRPTQKRAYVFDLGFQGHMGRSQLFQLLEKFSMAEYLFPHPVLSSINQTVESHKENSDDDNSENKDSNKQDQLKIITTYPRVTYKDKLILQRKNWLVPKSLLPTRHPMDSDWQYFKRVNFWRKENNIPDEVFVYVNNNRFGGNIDPELTKKLTRDDYKPQYINFNNPLMVNLLEKLIGRVPLSMKIVEMLPNSEQMLKIDDKRYVSEFVVQWYNFN